MNLMLKYSAIIAFPLLLSACCNTQAAKPTQQAYSTAVGTTSKVYAATDPQVVDFYQTSDLQQQPYQIIGRVAVNRFNEAGDKRQLGVMSDVMKYDAAMLGGEGLIDTHFTPTQEVAEVIRFKKDDDGDVSPYYTL